MNAAPMIMAPRNRAHTKFEVGFGGRYCACCDVPPKASRLARRYLKRAERHTIRQITRSFA